MDKLRKLEEEEEEDRRMEEEWAREDAREALEEELEVHRRMSANQAVEVRVSSLSLRTTVL